MLALRSRWEAAAGARRPTPRPAARPRRPQGEAANERAASRAAAEAEGDEDGDGGGELTKPAGDILATLIEDLLPERGDGAAKAGLLHRASGLELPNNPLDELIDRLGGGGRVAEMTGRKNRMERQGDGRFAYVRRVTEAGGTDRVNLDEKAQFQSGAKRVCIISDAASTGISLQAGECAARPRFGAL